MKKIAIFLFSLLLVFAVNKSWQISLAWYQIMLFSFILGLVIVFLSKNKYKFQKSILFNSLLFAIFLEWGVAYEIGGSIAFLWKNLINFFLAIFQIVAFTYLFYLLLSFLLQKFQNMKDSKLKSKIMHFILEYHPFLSVFVITISMSLLYLVFFYPGSMAWDGLWQLDFYYGVTAFKDHHPAVLTLLMGFLMDIGRSILNDNLGMFLFILLQIIINALTYAYTILIMKKMHTPYLIRFISFIFYAFFPFLIINSITYIKDTLFYLIFLFFFVYLYYHFYVVKDYKNKKTYLIVLLLSLSLYLTRNTGFYIVLLTFLAFFVFYFKKDKRVSLIFLVLSIFILGTDVFYHKVFLVKMDILEAPIREKLSVPLQQTARYLKYYPNDLSTKERKTLENVFTSSLKEISEIYEPNRSDNVKFKFEIYPTNQELKEYFKVWGSMFLKHPFVYVDATLNNTYGYFYPLAVNFIDEEIGFYDIEIDGWVNEGTFNFKRNNLDWGRSALEKLAYTISDTPILKLLYTPAFYVWIFISISIYFLARKRWDVLIYFVPLMLVLAFCLISPVNGHMRYLQPVMITIPFLIAIFYQIMHEKKF